jgi:hypothetical protein
MLLTGQTPTTPPGPVGVPLDDTRLRGLRRFNTLMGGLHLVQAALMLALSTSFSLPVMTSFLQMDQARGRLVPNPTIAFELQVGPLVALFLFISAVAHFMLASVMYPWYVRNLARGANYLRWTEYAFSSSVMIVIVAMLAGIYDLASLLLMFTLNAVMNLFGWMMELHNQATRRTDWTSFLFGCVAGIAPWIAIAIYLFGAGSGDAKPPAFVFAIFGSIFVFFNVFAVNMVLQYRKVGRWRDYLFGERVYIVLSLVAKSLLAWQVFFGTLRPV